MMMKKWIIQAAKTLTANSPLCALLDSTDLKRIATRTTGEKKRAIEMKIIEKNMMKRTRN